MLYNQPKIYENSVKEEIKKLVPNFEQLLDEQWRKGEKNKVSIQSTSGMEFISFAKGSKVREDIYTSFVAPSLESNLYVETWRRGAGGALHSDCKSKFQTVNVEYVTVTGVQWKYVEDHSKWAITDEEAYTCVGDINRVRSQFKRGGGTVCLNDATLWKAFHNSVLQTEACKKKHCNNCLNTTDPLNVTTSSNATTEITIEKC
ncbi:plancitoxin-1-like protein [Leptotrombidium deliense]|uniref:Plancitoxin-1-like protein n=1 Tax=Leptotrombidium deliense TaxID=299467 RepID=A0A443S211_9ACAR|nr:plancitoxin-1-like protein [Leptotrombidium deliense]